MQKRFRGLMIIGTVLKIIGIVELILALASLVILPLIFSANDGLFSQMGIYITVPGAELLAGLILGVILFLLGGISGLLLVVAGESINVLLAIEENTRASVILLQAQR